MVSNAKRVGLKIPGYPHPKLDQAAAGVGVTMESTMDVLQCPVWVSFEDDAGAKLRAKPGHFSFKSTG